MQFKKCVKNLFLNNLFVLKSQEMCDRTLDTCLSLLKIFPGWFVTNKMLKDFDNITFFSYIMDLVNLDLHNFSFEDDNFGNDDSKNIIHVRLPAGCNRQKQQNTCVKETSINIMPVAWPPTRWWNCCK